MKIFVADVPNSSVLPNAPGKPPGVRGSPAIPKTAPGVRVSSYIPAPGVGADAAYTPGVVG